MLAIIMAGGEGTRLRPLTCRLPKPMTPLLGKPVMEYTLDHLARHGITNVTATLLYRPEEIQAYFGERIGYYIEETPLGTAGGVKMAAENIKDTLLVASGDALTDIDFSAAIAFHRQKGAAATLVLTRVDCPQEFGVVVTNEDGRIERFLEKPKTGDVLSDTINTGIYILEPEALARIPDGPCDFGKDLFPSLVRDGLPLYGYIADGYWCDIGDIDTYLAAHRDALDGKISFLTPPPSGVFIHEDALVHGDAVVEGPCHIGEEAVVRAGARVGPYTVLGRGCAVLENASAVRSILWEGASLGPGAEARGALLLTGAQLGRQAQAYEGAVVGERTEIGSMAVLSPGALVWPYKQIEAGMRISGSLVWGGGRASPLSGRGMRGGRGVLTAEDCVALGSAMMATAGPACALVDNGTGGARAAADAFAAGYMGAGGRIYRLGAGTPQELRYTIKQLNLSGGCAIRVEGGALVLDLYGARAVELTDGQIRACRQEFLRRDRAPVALERVPLPVEVRGALTQRCFDFAQMLDLPDHGVSPAPSAPRLRLICPDSAALRGARKMLIPHIKLTNDAHEAITARISPDGETLELTDEKGRMLKPHILPELFAAAASFLYPTDEFYVPADASGVIERYAEASGISVERCFASRHAMLELTCGEKRGQQIWNAVYFDAAGALLILFRYLHEANLSLSDAVDALRPTHMRQIVYPIRENEKAAAMRRLIEATRGMDTRLGGGMRLTRETGWAILHPSDDSPEFRVVCEAYSSEAADELAGFCVDLLRGKL